jgi:hypothetical protein
MPEQLAPLAAKTRDAFHKTFVTRFGQQAFQNADEMARIYIPKYVHSTAKK